jgi:hypothetical protein
VDFEVIHSTDIEGRLQRLSLVILYQGMDDIIQLAETVSIAKYWIGIPDNAELLAVIRDCYRDLIRNGLAIVGDLDLNESQEWDLVRPWIGEPQEIADRVIAEWKLLERMPKLGEICWLELTDLGRTVARAFAAEGGSEYVDQLRAGNLRAIQAKYL